MQGNVQEVVQAGGGEYRGIQKGSRERRIPDLLLFNDPLTGTTLALVINERSITAQKVRSKIARSRETFRTHGNF